MNSDVDEECPERCGSGSVILNLLVHTDRVEFTINDLHDEGVCNGIFVCSRLQLVAKDPGVTDPFELVIAVIAVSINIAVARTAREQLSGVEKAAEMVELFGVVLGQLHAAIDAFLPVTAKRSREEVGMLHEQLLVDMEDPLFVLLADSDLYHSGAKTVHRSANRRPAGV